VLRGLTGNLSLAHDDEEQQLTRVEFQTRMTRNKPLRRPARLDPAQQADSIVGGQMLPLPSGGPLLESGGSSPEERARARVYRRS